MSIQELSPEDLAKVFCHYKEALAPGKQLASEPPHSWDEASPKEKVQMIAAARLALLELEAEVRGREDERCRYFPRPGSADWGC